MPDDVPEARWLPLREAAPLLGLERDTLRKQLARGERLGRRDNRGRWMVPVPVSAGMAPGISTAVPEASRNDASIARVDAGTAPDTRDAELAELREHVADLRAEVGWLRAELERRRWPGLWPALVRFWRGDGG